MQRKKTTLALLALLVLSLNATAFADDIYSGFIVNRKTKDKIALKCAEPTQSECTRFKAVLIEKKFENDPTHWTELNPEYTFSEYDLLRIEDLTKVKLQYRINPQGFNLGPIFPLTAVVNFLIEQNRHGGGPNMHLEYLYIIAKPADIITVLPIALTSLGIWGAKQGIIALEKNNVSKAFDSLDRVGGLKKIGNKNFRQIITLFRTYPW